MLTPEQQARKRAVSKHVAVVVPAGALAVLIVFICGAFGLDVPPEVAAAATTVITTIVGMLTYGKG